MADNMMASVPLAFSEGGDRCKFALPCDAIREIPKESRKVHTERLEAADRWFLRLLGTSQRGRRRVCGSAEEVTVLRASDEAVDFGTSLRGPVIRLSGERLERDRREHYGLLQLRGGDRS